MTWEEKNNSIHAKNATLSKQRWDAAYNSIVYYITRFKMYSLHTNAKRSPRKICTLSYFLFFRINKMDTEWAT